MQSDWTIGLPIIQKAHRPHQPCRIPLFINKLLFKASAFGTCHYSTTWIASSLEELIKVIVSSSMMGATATSSTTGIVSLLLVLLLCHHYVRAFSTFSSLPTTTVPSYSYTTVSNRSTRLSTTSLYAKKKNLKSFVRYLEIECWKRAELRELEPVLQAVAESCKQINKLVQRAQTDDLYGVALGADGLPLEDTNIQGEVQQQLDVLCNTMMLRAFCGCSSSIHSVASEEEDEPRCCSDVMVGVNKMFLLLDAACRLDSTSLTLLRLLPFSLSASVFSLD